MDTPWTIDDSRYVYEDPWMKVRVDRNTYAHSGKKGQHAVIEKRPFTVVLGIIEDSALFVKQIRYAVPKMFTELPMGYVEDGETPEEGARREFEEETGFSAKKWTYLGKHHIAPAYTTQVCHTFLAENLQKGEMNHEESEFLEIVRIPYTEALKMVDDGRIHDAATIVTLLRAKPYILKKI